jgi:5-oxoprolinase (ATP-hydrolysing) subunit C
MALVVLDPGLHALVVDGGRPSTRHLGVPVGGAADRYALALGNGLVCNPPNAPALEITASGPTLRADRPTAGVLFGAPFLAAVANKGRLESGTTFTLEAGDTLKIGGTPAGVRAYLCVPGGFSQVSLEPIRPDEVLDCAESRRAGRSLPFVALPGATPDDPIRIVAGPQYDWFLDPDRFFANEYRVSPASNRMGVRLTGDKLERRPGEMVSEPVAPGAIQITNDGQPIVLGVDGQTIGGYPKIAHVIRADLDRLAQLRPGSAVRFRPVVDDEAATAWRKRSAALREWLIRLDVATY